MVCGGVGGPTDAIAAPPRALAGQGSHVAHVRGVVSAGPGAVGFIAGVAPASRAAGRNEAQTRLRAAPVSRVDASNVSDSPGLGPFFNVGAVARNGAGSRAVRRRKVASTGASKSGKKRPAASTKAPGRGPG